MERLINPKYLKGDLVGAAIIIIVALLIATPTQFLGVLTTGVFIAVILSILFSKQIWKSQKLLLSLGRKTSLTSLLGILFAFILSITGGSLFNSLKLAIFLLISTVQAFVIYKLCVDWSISLEKSKLVQFGEYKQPLLLILVIFLITILFYST